MLVNLSASQSTYLLMSVTSLISVDTSVVCFVFFPVVLLQDVNRKAVVCSHGFGTL